MPNPSPLGLGGSLLASSILVSIESDRRECGLDALDPDLFASSPAPLDVDLIASSAPLDSDRLASSDRREALDIGL